MTTDDRTLPLAVGLDTFVVVLFVAIGLLTLIQFRWLRPER